MYDLLSGLLCNEFFIQLESNKMGKGGRPFKVHEDLNQLRSAAESGDVNRIKSIVKKHGIDAFDEEKRTALMWATFFGQLELLNWLIENKASVNEQDRVGYTALHFCGQEQNCEVAKILLDHGANPDLKD